MSQVCIVILRFFVKRPPGAYCRTIHLQDKSRTRLLVLDELFITIIHFLIMAVCFTSFHDIGYCLNHADNKATKCNMITVLPVGFRTYLNEITTY